MVKSISSRSTKAEIQEAFDELSKEYAQLENRHNRLFAEKEGLEKRLSEWEPVQAAAAEEPASVGVQPDQAHTIGSTLEELSALRSGFGGAANTLSARLTAEVTRLEALRHKAEARTQQLEELYGLTVEEGTLGSLIQEYEQRARTFQEQAQQARQAFDKEMAERQAAWTREQEEHARAVKEQREALKKDRQRKESEYKYNLDMAHAQAAEEYAQKRKKAYRELEEFVAAKQQEWQEYENVVAEQERVYEELKARAEALPRELEAAARRAEREGADLIRRQAKVQHDLLAKEEEGNRRVAEQRIQALEETIKQQAEQIKRLSTQLEAIVKQDQDLAVKAIEGASHETSFQSIREIALEQAKNVQKIK